MIIAKYVEYIKKVLMQDEMIEFTAQQRRVGPGGSISSPHIIVATNKRIIVFNKDLLGITERFDVIPYNRITNVELQHGVISSSIVMGVVAHPSENLLNESGNVEVSGLRYQDAIDLAKLVQEKITTVEPVRSNEDEETMDEKRTASRTNVTCHVCGTKNSFSSNYCENCGARL